MSLTSISAVCDFFFVRKSRSPDAVRSNDCPSAVIEYALITAFLRIFNNHIIQHFHGIVNDICTFQQ